MATPRQKVQVGVFLSICGLLLVGTLVVLSGVQREVSVPYFIEFDESVSGLAAGSDVRYRGVPVGRVTDIVVTTTNRIRVRVDIRPSIIHVRQGTTAQLGAAGITGQLYIDLFGGASEGPPLAANQVIPAIPSLFSNLTAELPTMLASINSILVRIDKTLGAEGQIATIVRDVGNIMIGLHSTVAEVNSRSVGLFERASTILEGANTMLEKEVPPLMGDLRATAKAGRRVLERTEPDLRAVLSESSKTLQQMNLLAEQLRGTSEELNLTLRHVRGETVDVTLQVRQVVRTLRETLLSAKRLIDYLEQDPAALLTGKRVPIQTQDRQGGP